MLNNITRYLFDYPAYFVRKGGVPGRYTDYGYVIKATGIGNRGRWQIADKGMRYHYRVHLFSYQGFANAQCGSDRIGIHFDYCMLICDPFIDILEIEIEMLKRT